MVEYLKKYMYIIENHLEDDLCDNIINLFENDNEIQIGLTLGGINISYKNTREVAISKSAKQCWIKIDEILFHKIGDGLKEYYNYCDINNIQHTKPKIMRDMGYNLLRYEKNVGEYKWHVDRNINLPEDKGIRTYTFIWYLNDIEEGGETEFKFGYKVNCKKGRLLIFPSNFIYEHRGNMPITSNKYIIVGWIYDMFC